MVGGAGDNAGNQDDFFLDDTDHIDYTNHIDDTDHIDVSQASDELDEVQARQLSFDLESAYNDFNKILHSS